MFVSPISPLVSVKLNSVVIFLSIKVDLTLLWSNDLKLLWIAKSYSSLKKSVKLLSIDPNKFDPFLLMVLEVEILFSSTSLSTVPNLNSKYLFSSWILSFL